MLWNHTKMQDIPRLEKFEWTMWAKVVAVYDGDTITIVCVFRGKIVRWRCRLIGYDSPELRSQNAEEKKKALESKEFLMTLLPKSMFRCKCKGVDKYGRLLIDLKVKNVRISEIMISNNHGYAYSGGKKEVCFL